MSYNVKCHKIWHVTKPKMSQNLRTPKPGMSKWAKTQQQQKWHSVWNTLPIDVSNKQTFFSHKIWKKKKYEIRLHGQCHKIIFLIKKKCHKTNEWSEL